MTEEALNTISLRQFALKHNIYSHSMLNHLFEEDKLISAKKVWNTIIIFDEAKELENLEQIKVSKWRIIKWRNIPLSMLSTKENEELNPNQTSMG